jgi:predicted TIM-barrel fold metal-dependent hydrolase
VTQFEKLYDRDPGRFDEDPMVTWRRSIFVHPFHEEDVVGLVGLLGADNVLFGSDYPHPEGLFDPVTFIDELDGRTDDEKRKVMGANLAQAMGIDPAVKILAAA